MNRKINIHSDGTIFGTTITGEDGREIKGVSKIVLVIDAQKKICFAIMKIPTGSIGLEATNIIASEKS